MSTIPESVMKTLRKRRDLNENDTSRDAEILAMEPIQRMREVCMWELGAYSWADDMLKLASDCGITVELN